MKFLKIFAMAAALSFLLLSSACQSPSAREQALQQQSRERYRTRYQKSGGFDPVSKSVGQRMP